MKKLLAMLMACTTLTCAFAACGDKDDDKKEKKNDKNPLLGTWEEKDDKSGMTAGYMFKENGALSVYTDMSSLIYFDGDTLYFGGSEMPDEYTTFDGTTVSVSAQGQDLLKMERIEGGSSKDSYDGTWTCESDLFEQMGMDMSYFVFEIDGKSTKMLAEDMAKYEVDGDKLTMSDIPEFFSDDGKSKLTATFEIEGDTLTITEDDGEETVLTRVK